MPRLSLQRCASSPVVVSSRCRPKPFMDWPRMPTTVPLSWSVFSAKGRPADHPLIVHVRDAAALDAWAREVPAAARALAARYWPGPLTLVLLSQRARPHDGLTGGQDTVGLRCPGASVGAGGARAAWDRRGSGARARCTQRQLLRAYQPVAGGARARRPGREARGEGRPDPRRRRLPGRHRIDDRRSVTGNPRLLRPGAVTREQLQAALGAAVPMPAATRRALRAGSTAITRRVRRWSSSTKARCRRASTRCAPSGSRCSRRHARCSIAARRWSRARSPRPTRPNTRVACMRCCTSSTPRVRHASSWRGRHRAMPGMRCTIA